MIEYRQYKPSDFRAYKIFCLENFGAKKHQIKASYLNWLYEGKATTFDIALSDGVIVGMIHNFQAPVNINGKIKVVTVLHDLMVDKNHRGSVGLKLIMSALQSDNYSILPGAEGRLARAYGRLGSNQFKSYWYRKIIIPKTIFYRSKLKKISKYQVLADSKGLKFGCNKGNDKHTFIENSLSSFSSVTEYTDYLNWRFLANNSPLTFYVADKLRQDTVLFVVGKKNHIPYVRVFYAKSSSARGLEILMNFIERLASNLGIPLVLFSCFECPPHKILLYKPYSVMPASFIFSKKKNTEFSSEILSFCSDISFEGINPYE